MAAFAGPMVRIRLPPAAGLRAFGPGAAGDRCKVHLDAGKEAGQREQVAEKIAWETGIVIPDETKTNSACDVCMD